MTDMTPEAINKRLAEWAGWTLQKGMGVIPDYWKSPTGEAAHYPPDFLRSNAAMDLLGVLKEKYYQYRLERCATNYLEFFGIFPHDAKMFVVPIAEAEEPTIPEAVCNAICELIEREGR